MKNQRSDRTIFFISIIFFVFSLKTFAQAPTPVGPVPNARQIEWYHREIMAFFHFGINTFTGVDGVNEGDGKASPTLFNPTALDCNQWMRVLKAAGIPCGILVAKHADGFCNWPTAYTTYSVKNSPWKNGQGDVVKEFTDACQAAGIKAGIYLGPNDRHERTYGTPAYSDYYASQLSELMRNYGPIWEIWWDGAGADFLTTAFYTRWADTVHTLQPNCVIFGTKNSNPFADSRWVGNEDGRAGDPCWSTINLSSIRDEAAHINELNHGEINGTAYVPAESDVSIRPSWFYHSSEDAQVKTVEALWDIYCSSVGHNSVLLLNFAPDKRGLIPAVDSANAFGLKSWIDSTFKNNLASSATVTALHPRGAESSPSNLLDNLESTYYASSDELTTDTLIFNLGSVKTFDCLMLQEVIELGHRTTGWSVDYSTDGTNWKAIPEATGKQSIGYKWIVRFRPVVASQVRLRMTAGKACPAIHTFGIYKQPKTVTTDGCIFYQDANYEGNNVTLDVGNYTLSDLQAVGIEDNDISSIKVPVGYTVEAYSEDNFSGTKWTFTSDNPDLSTIDSCDNNISSIKVFKKLPISQNKTATASTSETNKGNTPNKGNDGDYTTRWCASNGNAPQWWKVDLGANYKVTGTEVVWEFSRQYYKYKIEVSANNVNWTLAADKTNNTDGSQIQRDSLTADSVRYVRITITGLPPSSWASFYEFSVFGSLLTGVTKDEGVLPKEFNLFQNYPNPFNPSTTIEFQVPRRQFVTIKIYNSVGQLIRTLLSEVKEQRGYQVQWDGKSDEGVNVSSGTYFYQVAAGNVVQIQKMILLK